MLSASDFTSGHAGVNFYPYTCVFQCRFLHSGHCPDAVPTLESNLMYNHFIKQVFGDAVSDYGNSQPILQTCSGQQEEDDRQDIE